MERDNEGIGDAPGQTYHQQQQQQEQQQQHVHETSEASTARPTAVNMSITTAPTNRLTSVQLMQQRPREKFGNAILRTPEEMAMREGRREENVGTSSIQSRNLTATTKR
jgi:methylthioribose-1-phosphate isomerase